MAEPSVSKWWDPSVFVNRPPPPSWWPPGHLNSVRASPTQHDLSELIVRFRTPILQAAATIADSVHQNALLLYVQPSIRQQFIYRS
ncbi:hypothetical protein VTI74DRAFT_5414 [Chaetomium olivicolor]